MDAAHFIGLVAGQGGILEPGPYADVVVLHDPQGVARPALGSDRSQGGERKAAIDKAVFPMMQGGPQMHTIAAKAVNFKECATPEYQAYATQVMANAKVLAEALGSGGIRPTTGGTDTHLSLHDLQPVLVTGVDAEARCDAAGITLNKNAIPSTRRSPTSPRASRVGTPCVTTQGMGEAEMRTIADPHRARGHRGRRRPDHAVSKAVRAEVTDLVTRFPAYSLTTTRSAFVGLITGEEGWAAVREYLFIVVIAAVVTYAATPLLRSLAVRLRAFTPVRDRDVHSVPIPRLGGPCCSVSARPPWWRRSCRSASRCSRDRS